MKLMTPVYLVPMQGTHEALLPLGLPIHLSACGIGTTLNLLHNMKTTQPTKMNASFIISVYMFVYIIKSSIFTHPLCCCCWVPPFCKICRQNNKTLIAGSEVLTAVVMKSSIFWNMMPCSLLKVNRCSRGTRWFLGWLTHEH
jgi:hypothetical protein